MSCREFQNRIVLSPYEELQDGERAGLEAHLRECGACRQAMEEQESLHGMLAEDHESWELPPDLLMESRRALADELDRIEQKRSWWRMPAFSVVFTPMRMLESATLVAMGLALGVYINNSQATTPAAPASSEIASIESIPQNGRVSNVRIVSADTSSGRVTFAGDVVQPLEFEGNMQDDFTRRLLFSAIQDSVNPGARLQAVDVLARESDEPSVKEVLIHSLLNDESLNVRVKALEALKPFAGEDNVRTAFMEALMGDPNDGVRVAAVDALAGVTNTEVNAKRIEAVTREDDNTYVRLKGQGLLQLVGSRR
jgi:hypothetical protein